MAHERFWQMTGIFFGYFVLTTIFAGTPVAVELGALALLVRYMLWSAAASLAAALWWSSQYREDTLAVLPRSLGYFAWLFGALFLAFLTIQLVPGEASSLGLLAGGAWLLATLPMPARVLHLGPSVDPQRFILDFSSLRDPLIFLVVASLVVVVADHLGTRIALFFASALPQFLVPWVAVLLTSMGWALVAPRLFQWHQEVVSGSYRWP